MDVSLLPMAGINNVAEDAALQRGGDAPKLYVRDAVNVDITESGLPQLRSGVREVTTNAYRNLWQSPLHGDVFGTLGDQWVRINPNSWTHEALATIGEGDDVSHEVLNNRVVVSGPAGLFVFDGSSAQRLTFDSAAPPMVAALGGGSLAAGTYGVAVAWLRGDLESQTSEATFVEAGEGGLLRVAFPLCMDPSVTGVRLYLTRQDGGELARAGDYPANADPVDVPLLPELGRPAQFRHLSTMPAGAFLRYWRGRLLTARLNVLRWSEAMGYTCMTSVTASCRCRSGSLSSSRWRAGSGSGKSITWHSSKGLRPRVSRCAGWRRARRSRAARFDCRPKPSARRRRVGARWRCGWPRTDTCWARPAAR